MSAAPGLPSRQVRLARQYKTRNRTKWLEAIGAFVGISLALVGTLLAVGLFFAWPVMVALGVWHSYVHQVPALGLFATFVSVIAVHAVFHSANAVKTDK